MYFLGFNVFLFVSFDFKYFWLASSPAQTAPLFSAARRDRRESINPNMTMCGLLSVYYIEV